MPPLGVGEGGPKGSKRRLRPKPTRQHECLPDLGAQVGWGEWVTLPQNKASNSLRPLRTPATPPGATNLVSDVFSSQTLLATQEMEINIHSRQNKSFPSCMSAPRVGRNIVLWKPIGLPLSHAQSLNLPGHTQMTRRPLKSLTEEWKKSSAKPTGGGAGCSASTTRPSL